MFQVVAKMLIFASFGEIGIPTTFLNLSSSISKITDVNMAQESTNYAKYQILVNSGTAMLTQANTLPQAALRLIQ